jgi:hypothetical protein
MTHDPDRRDLEEAERLAEESRRRAAEDLAAARARSVGTRKLASRLRRLREENGFEQLFLTAMRGTDG